MKVGEEILSCEPFAYVVSQSLSKMTCDHCLRQPDKSGELKKCTGCRYLYYCGRECQRPAWPAHRDECAYLKAVSPKVPTDTVRLIARIIIKLRHGGNKIIAVLPDGSKRRFDDLISHTKDIVNDSCRIRAFDAFFGVLRDCFRDLGDVPPKPEVLDIYGRVMVNSFNIMNPEFQSVGIGLYLEASALDHSCRPNATVAFQGKRIAVRCILEGVDRFSDVRISYCNTLNLRERRRKDLREQYYFECRCEECEDKDSATEAKKAACLKCPSCSRGVPVSEADREVTVRCEHCQAVVPDDRVRRYWSVRDEVVEALFSDSNRHPEPSEQCGEFIGEMEGLFHPAERNYLDVLENCYEEALREENWQRAFDLGRQLLVGYEELHPKYDVNTGLLLLKLAKLANLLERTVDALAFVRGGLDQLKVCYGSDHPFVRDTVLPIKLEIEELLKEEEDEEMARRSDGDEKNAVQYQSG